MKKTIFVKTTIMKYRIKKGFEDCTVYASGERYELLKCSQTKLSQLFKLGVPEVEVYEESKGKKS
jgi:hypothetical protein